MWPRLLFADWWVPLLTVTSHFSVLGSRINEILDVSTSKPYVTSNHKSLLSEWIYLWESQVVEIKIIYLLFMGSWISIVGIMTRLCVAEPRNHESRAGRNKHLHQLCVLPSILLMGTTGLPTSKWQRCRDDHSHLSSANIKNKWSSTFTSPYAFMACTGPSFTPGLFTIAVSRSDDI
jgi:hypothetical protein